MGLPESAPEVAETGVTFEENALLKARAAVAATGMPSVADDSGLSVDALNAMPGVLSARWSGLPAGDPSRMRPTSNSSSRSCARSRPSVAARRSSALQPSRSRMDVSS